VDLDHCDEDADVCLECIADAECDDGLFCSGEEACVANECVSSGDPCTEQGLYCSEADNQCLPAPTIIHIYQDNGAVRGGKDNINPDGPASIQARAKGITVCTIVFSEDVDIAVSDVQIRDVYDTVDEVSPETFVYDPMNHALTMTWPEGTFRNQWVRIHVLDSVVSTATGAPLDGEVYAVAGDPGSGFALDGQLPSGDGVAGGMAAFVLGALEGDVSGNRIVNVTDRGIVQQYIGTVCPDADIPSDITGNCVINVTDRGRVQQNIGATLPMLP
jgi:hypothetical protein